MASSGISLINISDNLDPNTEPCGTNGNDFQSSNLQIRSNDGTVMCVYACSISPPTLMNAFTKTVEILLLVITTQMKCDFLT